MQGKCDKYKRQIMALNGYARKEIMTLRNEIVILRTAAASAADVLRTAAASAAADAHAAAAAAAAADVEDLVSTQED
jgi:Mg2+ and Co2+ transporter CorA